MKIKYAVVSSNSNPDYFDFWPAVARAWKRLDIEPVLLYIDSTEPPPGTDQHGTVFFLNSMAEWSIAQQAQCIRFWAARLLDQPFIISDIDMLPINADYYKNGAAQISETGLVSYSSDIINYRWYRTNPQYPMCYIAGDPVSFIQLLELTDTDHHGFFRRLMKLGLKSGTDQKFFYNQSLKSSIKITHLERGWIDGKYAYRRLDKANWPAHEYNVLEYIDCHMPKPLSVHRAKCEKLFNCLW